MNHSRLISIDLLRGIVIVMMALDHVRDFFGPTPFSPEDLDRTTPALFLTRWITDFCAPVFVFLAGTSALLFAQRHSTRETSRFLFTRGAWLILIEFFIISPSWLLEVWIHEGAIVLLMQVIWAIGWSMIVLSALVWLPVWMIGAFGVALMASHNLVPHAGAGFEHTLTAAQQLHVILHGEGAWLEAAAWLKFIVRYSLVPWVGVMAAGYAFGAIIIRPASQRDRLCFAIGGGMIVAFIVLRCFNLYGEPQPWSPHERGGVFTILSLLNTTKYPASLQFLLMTLGPAILMLPLLERCAPKVSPSGRGLGEDAHERQAPRQPVRRVFTAFGRVPFFFYALHVPVIHLAAVIYGLAHGWIPGWWWLVFIDEAPPNYTLNLWLVWGVWIALVAGLYPLCRWYADLKRRRAEWWLRYL